MKRGVMLAVLLMGVVFGANAADWSSLPKKKQTEAGLYMTAKDAYEHVKEHGKKTLFLDIRSRAEVNFLGMPTVTDANVPYMLMNEWHNWDAKKHHFALDVNSDFENEVARRLSEKKLTKNDTIILMCRSGSRSAKAANLLASLGYTKVYTVVDGYEGDKAKDGPQKGQRSVNGWRNANLPWSYKLDKNQMYKVAASE